MKGSMPSPSRIDFAMETLARSGYRLRMRIH